MKTSIAIFEYLDKIRAQERISDVRWAAASAIRRPTIPELRSRALSIRKGGKPTGRPCTVDKISLLFSGLFKLIGGEALRKKILDIIEDESNQTTRMIVLAMMTAERVDQETKDHIEQAMKLAVKNVIDSR